jgi:hypothetical protein
MTTSFGNSDVRGAAMRRQQSFILARRIVSLQREVQRQRREMVKESGSTRRCGPHLLFRALSASKVQQPHLGRCPRLLHLAPLALGTGLFSRASSSSFSRRRVQ